MRKITKNRVTCFICALLLFCTCLPFSAFAVDPVSAGVMANAFAQAIAAYGASSGVAMSFDVSNSSGIGDTMHELWSDFRAGTQDADDYETLAAALFPDLYYKAVTAAGTAVEAATIGYNISSEYAEEFDNFYNWLLSGPLEMVRVDNEYFEFSSSPGVITNVVSIGNAGSFRNQPFSANTSFSISAVTGTAYTLLLTSISSGVFLVRVANDHSSTNISNMGFCDYGESGSYASYSMKSTKDGGTSSSSRSYSLNTSIIYGGHTYFYSARGTNWATVNSSGPSAIPCYFASDYASDTELYSQIIEDIYNPPHSDFLGVGAYNRSGIADIPDTADPNYEAVGKRIPSDIPWDDSLFGDGTGTMTDAQSEAAADTADGIIERDKTLPLAGEQTANPPADDDPPSSDPDDYLVLGLEDVFPFCIPFDIYNFLAALAANPVAPHFICTLDFPEAIGGEQTIDIDFDTPTFNQLAQLLRTLELLAFIVGLALLTRSMFIRG